MLENFYRVIQPAQPNQADSVSVLRITLRFQQSSTFFEVPDRRSALPLAIAKNRKHSVGGWIVGPQLYQAIQQRHPFPITRLIVELAGAGQSRNVVGRNLQRLLE